jgi:hypothetical protein
VNEMRYPTTSNTKAAQRIATSRSPLSALTPPLEPDMRRSYALQTRRSRLAAAGSRGPCLPRRGQDSHEPRVFE